MTKQQENLKYKRIMLKISGEGLCASDGFGVDIDALDQICRQLQEIHAMGLQICLVIGGGNIIRGKDLSEKGINRSNADYMGMLATIINGLALQDSLERIGVPTRVMSAISVQSVAEPYILRRAKRHLEKGRVVVFVGGTGNTHFTTDTAAAVRAVEMNVEVLMKATKVDGVFTADPMLDPTAVKYESLTYREVITRNLQVMDQTAISLCMENQMPILVFNLMTHGNLKRIVMGDNIGTAVGSKE